MRFQIFNNDNEDYYSENNKIWNTSSLIMRLLNQKG